MTGAIDALFGLRGRSALVAGASRGLGAALADGLAAAGADVLAIGRSPEPAITRASYEICDVRDAEAFDRVARHWAARFGGLSIYVHVAGVTTPGARQSVDLFRETLETNLTAAYECTQLAADLMTESGGAIVLVSSIGARLGFPQNPAYAASKGGISALTRALALDFGPRAIRVNSVAPGYIRTAMTEAGYQDPDRHEARRSRTMLGRWGTPDDVVGAVIYLTSEASRYVTGHELVVDGGWTAKGL